jgi:hypothetical protein
MDGLSLFLKSSEVRLLPNISSGDKITIFSVVIEDPVLAAVGTSF